jgi:ATP phosphoribosyltransferase
MANESWVYGSAVTHPYAGEVSVDVVTTGGTLTGSNLIELRVLKSSLGAAANKGFNEKQNVLRQLEMIHAKIAHSDWPPLADSLV